eukprot:TCALIF_08491-PA protein Name:"Protein of unknown function" AED:0.00 eAED:0.00 QI:44/1/1/1/0/0.5/2/256/55
MSRARVVLVNGAKEDISVTLRPSGLHHEQSPHAAHFKWEWALQNGHGNVPTLHRQ